MILSTNKKNNENINTITKTIAVVIKVSFLVGHTIFWPSCFTSLKNLVGLKSFIILRHYDKKLFKSITSNVIFDNYKILLEVNSRYFMAGVEGLEPTAPGFGDRCSTN